MTFRHPLAARQTVRRMFRQNSCIRNAFLVLLFLAPAGLPASASDWTAGTGNWSSDGTPGWNGTGVPNAVGAIANFGTAANVTGSTAQDVPGGVTVGTISFSAGNANVTRFIAPTNGITLNQDGGGPGMATISNSNTSTGTANALVFQSGGTLTLADDLLISNTGGSTAGGGAIQMLSTITGTGNLTLSNTSNAFPTAASFPGAIRITGTNTFTGTVLIEKGLTTFNNSSAFGNVASNTITMGQSGQGNATLVSTSAVNLTNNIVAASGTGGTSILGTVSTASTNVSWSGTVALNGNLSLTSALTGTTGLSLTNTVSGAGGLTKVGAGVARLSGSSDNTYTGKTTVSAGTLILGKTAGLNAISSTGASGADATNTDLQITGGSVRTDANNQIVDTAKIGLSGGTLQLNGVQEGTTAAAGVGALTLSASSIIDLTGTSLLHFAASGGQTWSGTLSIYNWTGSFSGGGAEQLLFGTSDSSSSLTQAQLDAIVFYSDAGTTSLGTARFVGLGTGEIAPVPEPGTWAAGLLTVAALGYTQRRRFAKLLSARWS